MRMIFAFLAGLCIVAPHAFAADADPEIMSQGGASVTLSDVDAFLERMPENRRGGFLASPTRVEQMLISILRNKQLAKQAVDMKLDQQPALKQLIKQKTEEMLAEARVAEFQKALVVPSMEAAAKEEYAAHKADYVIPAQIEVQHVLISNKTRSDADAKALAEKVQAEAKLNPGGFDDLVQKYSDDSTKGAQQGYVPNAIAPNVAVEFGNAARALKNANDISPVTKTSFGYHILRLIKIHPERQVPFAEAKDKIVAKLQENFRDEQKKIWLSKLDSEKMNINPEMTEILRKRYVPSEATTPAEADKASGK